MKKAFTLIELLVVVLIIGILAAVALPQYQKAVARTRFMQLIVLQDAIERAENVYYLANGSYTSQFDELDIQMPAGGTTSYNKNEDQSWWISGGYTVVLTKNWSQGFIGSLSYVRFRIYEKRECRVYDNDAVARGVCLALGGLKQDDCSSCDYEIYIF